MNGKWAGSLWTPRVSNRQYAMVGKPDSEGWAKFQCLENLERVREWRVSEMNPANHNAREALAELHAELERKRRIAGRIKSLSKGPTL